MSFISLIYLIFLPTVTFIYYILPKKYIWILFVLSSWFFYAFSNIKLFLILPTISLITFFGAIFIEKSKNKGVKKLLLILNLLIIFGILIFFKYINLIISSFNSILNLIKDINNDFSLDIILPIGISFFTFQSASYVIDVYLEKIKAEKHFGWYSSYIAFFPQLVAGPIEKYSDLMPELKEKHAFDSKNIKQGFQTILIGFFKKIVVADSIALVVDKIYGASDLSLLSSFSVLSSTFLFAFQIYADFSGYSDIAIGSARLMGIKLSKNFDRPFSSESISEFWTRWHISLSRWFREYIFMPLSYKSITKKHKFLRHLLICLLIMLLSGIWHGSNYTFILWGLLLGVIQIIEIVAGRLRKRESKNNQALSLLRKIKTFALIMFSMILFRASSVEKAFVLFTRLFTGFDNYFSNFIQESSITLTNLLVISIGIISMLLMDKYLIDDYKSTERKTSIQLFLFSIILVFVVIIIYSYHISLDEISSFIYFRF